MNESLEIVNRLVFIHLSEPIAPEREPEEVDGIRFLFALAVFGCDIRFRPAIN